MPDHVRDMEFDRPVEMTEGVFWVGFNDRTRGLHCNPYLIIDGEVAVLIDGGSRPEFSTVMRKILQTGIEPRSIAYLIYQHYDPDLCGSIPNLEDIIDRPDLKLISKRENNVFIRYYSVRSEMLCIDALGHSLELPSGRRLRFIHTPFAHAAGSFMTYDENSGILFSSDLFGALDSDTEWRLYFDAAEACVSCANQIPDDPTEVCPEIDAPCPWSSLYAFHRQVMPSRSALCHAVRCAREIGPSMIAPQHGSVLHRSQDIAAAINRLEALEKVGFALYREDT
ncbi:MAG: hypothetical protein CMM08_01760 [Rhodospirillaceae bacterium]|jgi:glyoxylase-like metal-dependent hydrolase (beta-lactamase superfamily II)|nr:hypothetical protein [Rhodospirillaceae bacterium]MDP6623314.1 MBL fold metallo-hydrolase [Alphaproteobacteria bacterium]